MKRPAPKALARASNAKLTAEQISATESEKPTRRAKVRELLELSLQNTNLDLNYRLVHTKADDGVNLVSVCVWYMADQKPEHFSEIQFREDCRAFSFRYELPEATLNMVDYQSQDDNAAHIVDQAFKAPLKLINAEMRGLRLGDGRFICPKMEIELPYKVLNLKGDYKIRALVDGQGRVCGNKYTFKEDTVEKVQDDLGCATTLQK